jgi:hypothetical protein
MWRRLSNPDVLIFLQASYPVTMQRKPFKWSQEEYQKQLHRLRNAHGHADIFIDTDDLTPEEVLATALEFLNKLAEEK